MNLTYEYFSKLYIFTKVPSSWYIKTCPTYLPTFIPAFGNLRHYLVAKFSRNKHP